MATRAQLMEAVGYARANGWVVINGNTLRRTWTIATPEANRSKGPDDAFGKWSGETYDRLLFVTIVGLGATRTGSVSVILGDSPAPWIGRNDTSVSLKRAIEVLTAEYDADGNAL